MDKMMKRYFNVRLFQSKNEKKILLTVEAILKSTVVYYLSLVQTDNVGAFSIVDELLKEYPEFAASDVDAAELNYLLVYRNMMKIALKVISPRRNKRLLMDICSLLECSGRVYITGGTQSLSTSRRVRIYEHEADVQQTKRPNRIIVPKVVDKTTTICECGSEILQRTIWRHNTSKRHIAFLKRKSELQPSSSSDTTVVNALSNHSAN